MGAIVRKANIQDLEKLVSFNQCMAKVSGSAAATSRMYINARSLTLELSKHAQETENLELSQEVLQVCRWKAPHSRSVRRSRWFCIVWAPQACMQNLHAAGDQLCQTDSKHLGLRVQSFSPVCRKPAARSLDCPGRKDICRILCCGGGRRGGRLTDAHL